MNLADALEKGEANEALKIESYLQTSADQRGSGHPDPFAALTLKDKEKKCPVHHSLLRSVSLKYTDRKGTVYGVSCDYCSDCNYLYVHSSDIKPVIIPHLNAAGRNYLILDQKDTKEFLGDRIQPEIIDNSKTVYVTNEVISDAHPECPVHQTRMVMDTYRLIYKDRKVDFNAYFCEACQKIIIGKAMQSYLEDECAMIGVPEPEYEPLVVKKRTTAKEQGIILSYYVENGKRKKYGNIRSNIPTLREDDTLVVTDVMECEPGHEVKDVLAAVQVDVKKEGMRWFACALGYCEECDKYFILEDDYLALVREGRPIARIGDPMNVDTHVRSGEIFNQENKRLARTEETIQKDIDRIKASPDFVEQYATTASTGLDHDQIQYMKGRSKSEYQPTITRDESYKKQPYTYRVDLKAGNNYRTYYLGPTEVKIGGKTLVISYNRSFGREIVNVRTTRIMVNGIENAISLQRGFDISEGRLFGYNDIKVENDIFDQSGITDQFLRKVLKMRRQQHNLVDIIATIQQNQDAIVMQEFNQNLAVQGCAGSGKTMVLLHRLSWLKENYPSFDFHKAVILTPNERFNVHIGSVVEGLRLDDIRRISLEKYYLETLGLYSKELASVRDIHPEGEADPRIVAYVYSDAFLHDFDVTYQKVIEERKQLEPIETELLKELDVEIKPSEYSYDAEYADALSKELVPVNRKLRELKQSAESAEIEMKEKQTILRNYEQAIEQTNNELQESFRLLVDGAKDEVNEVRRNYERTLREAEPRTAKIDRAIVDADRSHDAEVLQVKGVIKQRQGAIEDARKKNSDLEQQHNTLDEFTNQKLDLNDQASLMQWLSSATVYDETLSGDIEAYEAQQKSAQKDVIDAYKAAVKETDSVLFEEEKERQQMLTTASLIDEAVKDENRRLFVFRRQDRLKLLGEQKKDNEEKLTALEAKVKIQQEKRNQRPERLTAENLATYVEELSSVVPGIYQYAGAIKDAQHNYEEATQTIIRSTKTKLGAVKRTLTLQMKQNEKQIGDYQASIEGLNEDIMTKDSVYALKVQSLNQQKRTLADAKEHAEKHLKDIQGIMDDLNNAKDDQEILSIAEGMQDHTAVYKGQLSRYKELGKNLHDCQSHVGEAEEEAKKAEDAFKAIQATSRISECEEKLQQINTAIKDNNDVAVFRKIFTAVMTAYCKSQDLKLPTGQYRYNLYARLRFAQKYYAPVRTEYAFLCIDEAQDNSLNEYRLMNQLNAEDAVYNLYGDTRQLMNLDKGITSWYPFFKEFGMKLFTLNENYRNTNQITEFCNKEFGMDVAQTGVDGPRVREIHKNDLEDALDRLNVGNDRYAILIPRKWSKETVLRRDLIDPEIRKLIGDEIGQGVIALLYVDEVKGIEFDKVFVLPDGMSRNEQYIAYTRALNELVVVRTFEE